MRLPALASLAFAALLVSGCAGDTETTSGPTADGDGQAVTGNATAQPVDASCSAAAGATGSFSGNIAGNEVGGCTFTVLERDSTVLAADLPSGCAFYQTPPDSNQVSTNAQPAEVGSTYPTGTSLQMFCDATAVMPEGTITVVAA